MFLINGLKTAKERLLGKDSQKMAVLVLLILLCAGATCYFHIILHREAVFSPFFYLLVSLAGLWWGRRGAWVAVLLGALLIASHYLSGMGTPPLDCFLQCVMLVVVGLTVGLLSEQAGRSEKSLRETRDYLDSLIRCANAPIIVWDPEGMITRFNHAFEHFTGYTAGEVIGQELDMLFPEASRDESLREIERTLSGEYWESVEIPILRQDGETRLALWNSANVYAEDGTTLLATIAQGTDITERKRAEEALRESEARYRTLFNSISDSILLINLDDFTIIDANPAALKQVKMEEGEVVGKTCYEVTHLCSSPCKPPDHVCPIREMMETAGRSITLEHTHYGRDGNPFYIEVSASPVKDAEGRILHVVHIARDITERKRMEEALRAMALVDDLTGLYNRRGFFTLAEQQLKTADRAKMKMLLLFADVDDLKRINDTFGHPEGDLALIEVADVLREAFRESDIVARMAGDEFVVLALETTEDSAEIITTRLQEKLEARNTAGDLCYRLSLSVGIAHYDPEHACSIDELLAQADRLMYEQKQRNQMS